MLFFALTAAAGFVPGFRIWPCSGLRRVAVPRSAVQIPPMSTLAEIEEAIEQLPPETFRELREWIAERDWKQWDTQLEADAAAGKLDALREKVRADYAAGNCTDL